MDIRAIVAEGLGMGIHIQNVTWDDGEDQDVDHGAEWDEEQDALDLEEDIDMEYGSEYGDEGEEEEDDEDEEDMDDLD